MDELAVDPAAVIEAQAQEIARLTHRAILAETAVAQLRAEVARLAQAAADAGEQAA